MKIPITGLGAVCAAGSDVESAFRAVMDGRDCLEPFTSFDTRLKQPPLCAQVRSIPSVEYSRIANRTTAMAIAAVNEALQQVQDRSGMRIGVVCATTVAGMTRSELFYEKVKKDPGSVGSAPLELEAHEPAALSGAIGEFTGADGLHTLSTACSTGLHAIGMAMRLIQQGYYDACIAVGADALAVLTIKGFASLTLLDPNGCRPFDKRRAGISLGEGAAAMLLVSPRFSDRFEHIYGYVSGWGASADCHHMTAPHPEGQGAGNAVKMALDEAGIGAPQIGMIAAHGTGTPDNDKAEIRAMQSIFGTVPPFCSMKRTLGHTLAASGILESVFAVLALREQAVPRTCGFEQIDEEIGAAPSTKSDKNIRHILKNSFGFGGNNGAMIFSGSGS